MHKILMNGVACFFMIATSCENKKKESPNFEGKTYQFQCNSPEASNALSAKQFYVTELDEPKEPRTKYFLISDAADKNLPTNLILVVDVPTKRVDQVRRITGGPFQYSIAVNQTSPENARSQSILEFGKLILEDLPLAGGKSVILKSNSFSAKGILSKEANRYGSFMAKQVLIQQGSKVTVGCEGN